MPRTSYPTARRRAGEEVARAVDVDWARIRNWWENTRSGLWFIPSLLTAAALALAVALPELDARLAHDIDPHQRWLFSGSAGAARTLLSVIAGSLITVSSLLFSITMLTLQQAATQFTPRIFRTFTRDQSNQFVLGFYVATFMYSLLVLRQIRGDDTAVGAVVPTLSVTLAMLLALVCLALLVYFVHHNATLFQASTLIERVHHELLDEIDRLYPERVGEPLPTQRDDLTDFRARHPDAPAAVISSHAAGYLRGVDDLAIVSALPDGAWATVLPQVGWYVMAGQPLIEVGGVAAPGAGWSAELRDAFLLDRERTLPQDSLFGVRQLADIALKALSPAINDPTTAEHAISALGDALARLATRPFPDRERRIDSDGKRLEVWFNRPGFDAHVDEAFAQIRRVAARDVRITWRLLDTITTVARHVPAHSCDALRRHVEDAAWQIERADFSPHDRAMLQTAAAEALAAVDGARRQRA